VQVLRDAAGLKGGGGRSSKTKAGCGPLLFFEESGAKLRIAEDVLIGGSGKSSLYVHSTEYYTVGTAPRAARSGQAADCTARVRQERQVSHAGGAEQGLAASEIGKAERAGELMEVKCNAKD